MDHILSEYSAAVDTLKRQLQVYQAEHKELKRQVLKLVQENRKVTNELKESVEIRIRDATVIEELKTQLSVALQTKISSASVQPDDVGESSRDVHSSVHLNEVELRIAEVKGHYDKGLKILLDELSETQKQLASLRETHHVKDKELHTCQSNLEKSEKNHKFLEEEIKKITEMNKQLKKELFTVKSELADQLKVCKVVEGENSVLKERNTEFINSRKQLTEEVSFLRNQKSVLEKKARKSFLDAQGALLQKKALSYKEQLAKTFVEDLKQSISQEVDHAVSVHKLEAKSIEKECEDKVAQLEEEIKSLQRENCEKQSRFEKAVREKKALESVLKSGVGTGQPLVSGVTFEEMCQKLYQSEKTRDEAVLRVESLDNSLRDMQQNHKKETEFLMTEAKHHKDKLQRLKTDLAKALQAKVHLTEQAEDIRKKYVKLEKHLHFVESQQRKEVAALKEASQKELESLQLEVQNNEDYYKKYIIHLRHMLNSQHQMNQKWKNAFQDLTVTSELKIKEILRNGNP